MGLVGSLVPISFSIPVSSHMERNGLSLRGNFRCVALSNSRARAGKLPGLERGAIPIKRVSCAIPIRVGTVVRTRPLLWGPTPSQNKHSVHKERRFRMPLSTSLLPPRENCPYPIYEALLQSSGRNSLRLLRDFDDDMFLQSHEVEMIEEDKRLETLNTVTENRGKE